jgi:enterochelin esterase-like enzyme
VKRSGGRNGSGNAIQRPERITEPTAMARRRFLVGGLAAAIVGTGGSGVAATQRPGRRLLHAAGLLEGSSHPAPEPPRRFDVEHRTLRSVRMRGSVRYAVALPPGVDPTAVVYCLHGRGGNERFAVGVIRFQDFLAEAGLPVAVVAPDGGPDSYWHPRRTGRDPLGMLVRELVPLVDAELGPLRRGLLGWSMGGYGALLAAERNPALFPAVALSSPALWRRFDETADGAFDGEVDFRAHDVFTATDRLDGVAVAAWIGRDDPFLPGFRDLRGFRPDGTYRIGKGFHDGAYWRSVAPEQVRFFEQWLVRT